MKKKFDFEKITLMPKYSQINTRSECDTSVNFGGYRFKLPVVPANMESIIDERLAIQLAKNGYFYILHRFEIDEVSFIRRMKSEKLFSSISIGVNDDSYELIEVLIFELKKFLNKFVMPEKPFVSK